LTKKTLTVRPLAERTEAPPLEKRGRGWRGAASIALAVLPVAPVLAKQPPSAVRAYTDCVLENFRHPGEEKGATFDEAQDLAKAQCGNLRPDAVAAVHRSFGKRLTVGGDDADVAAQAFLDIMVEEQTAAIWAEWHPEESSHGR